MQLVIPKSGLAVYPVDDAPLHRDGHLRKGTQRQHPPQLSGSGSGSTVRPGQAALLALATCELHAGPANNQSVVSKNCAARAYLQAGIGGLVVAFGAQLVLCPEGHASSRQLSIQPLLVLVPRAVPHGICGGGAAPTRGMLCAQVNAIQRTQDGNSWRQLAMQPAPAMPAN